MLFSIMAGFPLELLDLQINPNLAAFHCATCHTKQTLKMKDYFVSLWLNDNNKA